MHCGDNWEGRLFSWLHVYYVHLASVRFEHSACHGSLIMTIYICILMVQSWQKVSTSLCWIFICIYDFKREMKSKLHFCIYLYLFLFWFILFFHIYNDKTLPKTACRKAKPKNTFSILQYISIIVLWVPYHCFCHFCTYYFFHLFNTFLHLYHYFNLSFDISFISLSFISLFFSFICIS